MKRTYLLVAVLTVAIWACSENTPITEPNNQANSSVAPSVTAEPNWVKLPAPKYPSLKKSFSVTQMIYSDQECSMIIDESYEDVDGNEVNIWVQITFLAGSLNEDTEITMSVDDETAVMTFLPHMSFNKNAILSSSITAAIFEGVSKQDVDFDYMAEDGTYEEVDVDKISVNSGKGRVSLVEAALSHFSRYGFTK